MQLNGTFTISLSFSHSLPYNPQIGRQKAGQLYNIYCIYLFMSLCKSLRPAEMVFGRKEVDVGHKSQRAGAWTTVTQRAERDIQI